MKTLFSILFVLFFASFSANAEVEVGEVITVKEFTIDSNYKNVTVTMNANMLGASPKMMGMYLNKALVQSYKKVGYQDLTVLEEHIIANFKNSCHLAKVIHCKPTFIFANTKD
tara:strand:- start:4119 stop:4457 length:339 start_codon:yes stop_codon:yes gene_type:complete